VKNCTGCEAREEGGGGQAGRGRLQHRRLRRRDQGGRGSQLGQARVEGGGLGGRARLRQVKHSLSRDKKKTAEQISEVEEKTVHVVFKNLYLRKPSVERVGSGRSNGSPSPPPSTPPSFPADPCKFNLKTT
jgi:hypothetical protein